MEDDDWSFWPAIGSPGALHDLRDDDGPPEPRLLQMRSVSHAAAHAMQKRPKPRYHRRIGFAAWKRK